jgi:hypothetical protein
MVNPSKVKPGQKAIDGRTWNGLVDMLTWWQRTYALGGGGAPVNLPRETDLIRIRNDTGGALAKFSVLQVDEYLLTELDKRRLFYAGTKADHGAALVASLQWTAGISEIVEAQISGVGPVLVNVGATWHRRARPTKDATVLTSGLFGPFEILGTLTATGEQTCVCRHGHSGNRGMFAKTTSSITAGSLSSGRLVLGSGTATIYDPYTTATQYADASHTATVYNMPGEAIPTGTFISLTPTDDWLPLAEIEPCTNPA